MVFRRRLLRLYLVAVLSLVVVGLRVIQLQVFEGEHWQEEARRKRERVLDIDAPRGRIFDRDGRVLARDVPIFQLALVGWDWEHRGRDRCSACGAISYRRPGDPPRKKPCSCGLPGAHFEPLPPADPAPIERALGLEPGTLARKADARVKEVERIAHQVAKRLAREGRSDFLLHDIEKLTERDLLLRPFVVVPRVDPDVVRLVELDEKGRFRGFRIRTDLRREYPPGGPAGQLLGYVSVVEDWKELERLKQRYGDNVSLDTRIGRAGLEKSHEDLLLGQLGWECQARDTDGEFTVVVKDQKPRRGSDLRLALSADACREAEEVLRRWGTEDGYFPQAAPSGGFVAMDADTGEILAWGEMPRFEVGRDLQRLFREGKRNAGATFDPDRGQWMPPEDSPALSAESLAQWRARLSKPAPLDLSRVSQIAVEPGSTFKVFIGLGLLDGLHQLPPGTTLPFPGLFDCRRYHTIPACHGHGAVDFEGALEVSCNRYFSLSLRNGPHWDFYRRSVPALLDRLGFGHPTGADVYGERGGLFLEPYADFDPRALVKKAIRAVCESRDLAEAQILFRVSPRLPGTVAARAADRLADLVRTIVGAAADSVEGGRVLVRLGGSSAEDRKVSLTLEVAAQPDPEGPPPRPLDMASLKRKARRAGATLDAVVRPPGLLDLTLAVSLHEAVGRKSGDPPILLPDDGRNVAIGQGPVTVTPLQMVRAVAVIANGGRLVTPHVAAFAGDRPLPTLATRIPLDPDDVRRVRAGMRAVVAGPEGTARKAPWDLVPATVYGKTGTSEVGSWWTPGGTEGKGPWHHWFIGFAEHGGRKLAFACVLHARKERAAAYTAARAVCDFLQWWYREGPGAR